MPRCSLLWEVHPAEAFTGFAACETTFYVVTPNGILSYTAKTDDLVEGRDKNLSALFHQAHEVIAQIQMLEKPKDG